MWNRIPARVRNEIVDVRESTALHMELAACARGETPKVPMEHHY